MLDISDANILLKAFNRSVKTSHWKGSSQRSEHDKLSIIAELQDDIRNGTYKTGPLSTFTISERGKRRLIHGNTIRDRVVRHALCDEVLIPAVSKKVIYDNAASQKDKGVHFSRNRLKTHLHKYYRKFGHEGYILLIDFSRFYDNVIQSIAFEQLSSLLSEPQHVDLLARIFEGFKLDVSHLPENAVRDLEIGIFNALDFQGTSKTSETGKRYLCKSVPIGDQTSQIIGIWYPHEIDNYCKIVKSLKYYGRYMDDIYIIHNDKHYLQQLLKEIEQIAFKLGMRINHRKTQIFRIDKPFHFLQNSYFLTETGKVVEKINKKNLTRMRRKLKKLALRVHEGVLPMDAVTSMFRSWIGSYYKIMSREQLTNLQQLYFQLFGKEKYGRKTHHRFWERSFPSVQSEWQQLYFG